MKQINSKYSGNHSSLLVVFLGDLHVGHIYTDYERLHKTLSYIDKNRKRVRVVGMGDFCEAATKGSVGRAVFDESFHLQRQVDVVIDMFKRIGDVTDLVLDGNHEDRIMKDTSFEITENICYRAGISETYGQFQSILNIRMGTGLTYSIHAWHGATGGTTDAAAYNALSNMRKTTTSHIYAMGHTHKLFSFSKKHYLPNPNGDMAMIEQQFINTGSCLDFGAYSEQKGLEPSVLGFGAMLLHSNVRRAEFVKMDDLI